MHSGTTVWDLDSGPRGRRRYCLNHTCSPPFPELTDREREILALIAQGRTNPEIMRELVISLKTVQNHISNIFSKLQVADRAEAILRARAAGLGEEQTCPAGRIPE